MVFKLLTNPHTVFQHDDKALGHAEFFRGLACSKLRCLSPSTDSIDPRFHPPLLPRRTSQPRCPCEFFAAKFVYQCLCVGGQHWCSGWSHPPQPLPRDSTNVPNCSHNLYRTLFCIPVGIFRDYEVEAGLSWHIFSLSSHSILFFCISCCC